MIPDTSADAHAIAGKIVPLFPRANPARMASLITDPVRERTLISFIVLYLLLQPYQKS